MEPQRWPSPYLYCWGCVESRDHLFIRYGFSKTISEDVMKRCLVRKPEVEWSSLVDWNLHNIINIYIYKGESQKEIICKLVWGLLYPMCYCQHNTRTWEVKCWVPAKGQFKNSIRNTALCCYWGIHLCTKQVITPPFCSRETHLFCGLVGVKYLLRFVMQRFFTASAAVTLCFWVCRLFVVRVCFLSLVIGEAWALSST